MCALPLGRLPFDIDIGIGLVAGAVGAAAMTVSSTVEMRLRGREPSAVYAISTSLGYECLDHRHG